MPRIPVHTTSSAPEGSRDALEALEASFGKVLNIHGEMAHSPVVLRSYVALQQIIADHGSFDGRTRDAIALAVGNVDECSYCQAAHTAGGKAAKLTDDETISVRRGSVDSDPSWTPCCQWHVSSPATSALSRTARGRRPSPPAGQTNSSPSSPCTSR